MAGFWNICNYSCQIRVMLVFNNEIVSTKDPTQPIALQHWEKIASEYFCPCVAILAI